VSRHLAIGDIHGCITALTTLVSYVDLREDDVVVALGDYVDRGPDPAAVVQFILDLRQTHNVITLRGNHELMMLDSREQRSWFVPWMGYGGEATLESYGGSFDGVPDEHLDFLENGLVSFYECDSHFFVHAFADPAVALDQQSDANLYWRKYKNPQPHCSGKIMVCGHTAQRSGLPVNDGHSVCIDTWAHGEGWLTCLDVESGTIWQANEQGETRSSSIQD
jgi:serine/threonine protein phosphatase 1